MSATGRPLWKSDEKPRQKATEEAVALQRPVANKKNKKKYTKRRELGG
jgi:hypothetical protein